MEVHNSRYLTGHTSKTTAVIWTIVYNLLLNCTFWSFSETLLQECYLELCWFDWCQMLVWLLQPSTPWQIYFINTNYQNHYFTNSCKINRGCRPVNSIWLQLEVLKYVLYMTPEWGWILVFDWWGFFWCHQHFGVLIIQYNSDLDYLTSNLKNMRRKIWTHWTYIKRFLQ